MLSGTRFYTPLVLLSAITSMPTSIDARGSVAARGLLISGTSTEGGVPNRFSETLDLVSGHTKHVDQMGDSERQYGFDGQPWDAANGIVTISTLPAAIARESTLAWLDRQAWREKMAPNGRPSRRITPRSGYPVDLQFDPSTGLVKTATFVGDSGPNIVSYSDWRRVGSYTYPFQREQITAAGERTTVKVESATFIAALPAGSLARPLARSHSVPLLRGSVSVPFEPTGRKGTHILVRAKVNEKPARLVFDTGAANYLTSEAASQFGVHVTGGVNIGGVGESSASGGYANIDRIALGDAALRDETFVVGPSPFPPPKPGESNSAGFTGFEFFAEYVTTIDYPARKLRFANSLPKQSRALRVPFYNDGSHIYVKAKVNGIDGLYGLDTGDGGTVMIFPNFAARHALEKASGDLNTEGGGVGGAVKARAGVVGRFSLGGLDFDDLPVQFSHQKAGAFASRSLAGNLGGGVLQCFSITIDFPHHLLLFDPAPENPFCKPGGTVRRL